ncbi:MAG: NUDIX domain-containing protein [Planctomycetaceae bacterium]
MKQHGPWQIVESNEKYRDPWVTLTRDEVVRPDGKPGSYVVVTLKPGVCVLAVDDENNAYLTREFHYGVGCVTLEAVSGGIDGNEEPLVAAKRELQEEIGIEAAKWTDLGSTDPFTANVVSPTRMFLAEDLTFVETDPEGTELIECVKLPFDEVVERVMDGTITHSPSCLTILKTAFQQRDT